MYRRDNPDIIVYISPDEADNLREALDKLPFSKQVFNTTQVEVYQSINGNYFNSLFYIKIRPLDPVPPMERSYRRPQRYQLRFHYETMDILMRLIKDGEMNGLVGSIKCILFEQAKDNPEKFIEEVMPLLDEDSVMDFLFSIGDLVKNNKQQARDSI
jgi:hypothetical protein